jgi:hypothetical protein
MKRRIEQDARKHWPGWAVKDYLHLKLSPSGPFCYYVTMAKEEGTIFEYMWGNLLARKSRYKTCCKRRGK